MKADIDLYETDPGHYDGLQMLRPDYAHAKTALLELATKYFKDKKDIVLADFCSGTGINTKMLAGRISVAKAILIDINQKFIEIAKQSNINAVIEPVVSDILTVHLRPSADLVISMFAYHHVPDDRKS
jgi:trans-aconitate methyltransferase